MNSGKVLIGYKAICKYLDDMDERTLRFFFSQGLPHKIINRRVYAHSDNIDTFFQRLTKGSDRGAELPADEN